MAVVGATHVALRLGRADELEYQLGRVTLVGSG